MDTETGEMIVKRVSVPIGLEELMEGLVKEVLLKKPDDIYLFAARYFSQLLTIRDKVPVNKAKTLRSIQTLKEKPEKPVTSTKTSKLSKQFSIREEIDSPIISQKPKMYQRNELKYNKRRHTGPSTVLPNNQQLTIRRKYARSVTGESNDSIKNKIQTKKDLTDRSSSSKSSVKLPILTETKTVLKSVENISNHDRKDVQDVEKDIDSKNDTNKAGYKDMDQIKDTNCKESIGILTKKEDASVENKIINKNETSKGNEEIVEENITAITMQSDDFNRNEDNNNTKIDFIIKDNSTKSNYDTKIKNTNNIEIITNVQETKNSIEKSNNDNANANIESLQNDNFKNEILENKCAETIIVDETKNNKNPKKIISKIDEEKMNDNNNPIKSENEEITEKKCTESITERSNVVHENKDINKEDYVNIKINSTNKNNMGISNNDDKINENKSFTEKSNETEDNNKKDINGIANTNINFTQKDNPDNKIDSEVIVVDETKDKCNQKEINLKSDDEILKKNDENTQEKIDEIENDTNIEKGNNKLTNNISKKEITVDEFKLDENISIENFQKDSSTDIIKTNDKLVEKQINEVVTEQSDTNDVEIDIANKEDNSTLENDNNIISKSNTEIDTKNIQITTGQLNNVNNIIDNKNKKDSKDIIEKTDNNNKEKDKFDKYDTFEKIQAIEKDFSKIQKSPKILTSSRTIDDEEVSRVLLSSISNTENETSTADVHDEKLNSQNDLVLKNSNISGSKTGFDNNEETIDNDSLEFDEAEKVIISPTEKTHTLLIGEDSTKENQTENQEYNDTKNIKNINEKLKKGTFTEMDQLSKSVNLMTNDSKISNDDGNAQNKTIPTENISKISEIEKCRSETTEEKLIKDITNDDNVSIDDQKTDLDIPSLETDYSLRKNEEYIDNIEKSKENENNLSTTNELSSNVDLITEIKTKNASSEIKIIDKVIKGTNEGESLRNNNKSKSEKVIIDFYKNNESIKEVKDDKIKNNDGKNTEDTENTSNLKIETEKSNEKSLDKILTIDSGDLNYNSNNNKIDKNNLEKMMTIDKEDINNKTEVSNSIEDFSNVILNDKINNDSNATKKGMIKSENRINKIIESSVEKIQSNISENQIIDELTGNEGKKTEVIDINITEINNKETDIANKITDDKDKIKYDHSKTDAKINPIIEVDKNKELQNPVKIQDINESRVIINKDNEKDCADVNTTDKKSDATNDKRKNIIDYIEAKSEISKNIEVSDKNNEKIKINKNNKIIDNKLTKDIDTIKIKTEDTTLHTVKEFDKNDLVIKEEPIKSITEISCNEENKNKYENENEMKSNKIEDINEETIIREKRSLLFKDGSPNENNTEIEEKDLVDRVAKNYVNYVIDTDRYLLSENGGIDEQEYEGLNTDTDNNTESKSDEAHNETSDIESPLIKTKHSLEIDDDVLANDSQVTNNKNEDIIITDADKSKEKQNTAELIRSTLSVAENGLINNEVKLFLNDFIIGEKNNVASKNIQISGFDSAKLHEELKKIQNESKFTSFKTSFNPFLLHKEIEAATGINKKASVSIDFQKVANAASKIQKSWRRFKKRKSLIAINETNKKSEAESEAETEPKSIEKSVLEKKPTEHEVDETPKNILNVNKSKYMDPQINPDEIITDKTNNENSEETSVNENITKKRTIFSAESSDSIKTVILNEPKEYIKEKPDFHKEVDLLLDEILDYPTIEEEHLLDNYQNKIFDKIYGKEDDKFDDIKALEKIISPKRIEDIDLEKLKDEVHVPLVLKNTQNLGKIIPGDRKLTRSLSTKLEILEEENSLVEEDGDKDKDLSKDNDEYKDQVLIIKDNKTKIDKINDINEDKDKGKEEDKFEEKVLSSKVNDKNLSEDYDLAKDKYFKKDKNEGKDKNLIKEKDKNEVLDEEKIKHLEESNLENKTDDKLYTFCSEPNLVPSENKLTDKLLSENLDNDHKGTINNTQLNEPNHSGEFHETLVIPLPTEVKNKLQLNEKEDNSDTISAANLDQISSILSNAGLDSKNLHDTVAVPVNEHNIDTGRSQPISVQLCQTADAENVMTSPNPPADVTGSAAAASEGGNAQDPGKADLQNDFQTENGGRSASSSEGMESEKRRKTDGVNMEAQAATKIQAGFRGYQVRKQLKLKNGSSDMTTSKKIARPKTSGGMDIPKNQSKKSDDIAEQSAVKIQAGIRGFLVRRRQKKHSSQQA